MDKITVKRGKSNQKLQIVKGMYITITDHNSIKIDIEKPIDVITDIWRNIGGSIDIQGHKQRVEGYKKRLSESFSRKEKNISASNKRDLCVNARKDLAKFIDNKNKDYAQRLEFMAQFGKCISEINALEEEFANHFKEQIEKLERSIKDE